VVKVGQWLHRHIFGFTTITGIDFAKELCKEAILNMQKV